MNDGQITRSMFQGATKGTHWNNAPRACWGRGSGGRPATTAKQPPTAHEGRHTKDWPQLTSGKAKRDNPRTPQLLGHHQETEMQTRRRSLEACQPSWRHRPELGAVSMERRRSFSQAPRAGPLFVPGDRCLAQLLSRPYDEPFSLSAPEQPCINKSMSSCCGTEHGHSQLTSPGLSQQLHPHPHLARHQSRSTRCKDASLRCKPVQGSPQQTYLRSATFLSFRMVC